MKLGNSKIVSIHNWIEKWHDYEWIRTFDYIFGFDNNSNINILHFSYIGWCYIENGRKSQKF